MTPPELIDREALRLAAIDFESIPRADGGGDVPVQIGIVSGTGTSIQTETAWMSHTNPGLPLSPRKGSLLAPEIADSPSLLALWPAIRDSLRGRWIVAHGAGTEKRFLRTFPGHGLGPWIDTLRWSRAAYPHLPSHRLGDLCQTLNLESRIRNLGLGVGWHEALFDAAAALVLLHHLLDQLPPGPIAASLLQSPQIHTYHRFRRNP